MSVETLPETSRTGRPISSLWRVGDARTPRVQAYLRLLVEVSDWTEDQLRDAMRFVPAGVAARLKRGPLDHRYSCGICEAFGDPPDEPGDDILWRVYAYHEVPKLYMQRKDDQWYGALANEVYTRTIAVYRAAGWDGDAPEPDA